METLNYIGEVMPDGHISLPEHIAAILNLRPQSRIKVTIERLEKAQSPCLSEGNNG